MIDIKTFLSENMDELGHEFEKKKLHLCFDLSYFRFWISKILISSLKHFLSLHLLSYLHLKIYDCQHFQHTVHEYF